MRSDAFQRNGRRAQRKRAGALARKIPDATRGSAHRNHRQVRLPSGAVVACFEVAYAGSEVHQEALERVAMVEGGGGKEQSTVRTLMGMCRVTR